MRFMGVLRATPESEAGAPNDPEMFAKMGAFMEEVAKAGVLTATNGLQPSAKGARVKVSGDKVSVIDGPFAETKELIASYAMFQVNSKEEAIHWTTRFLQVLGEGECDIYQVYEAEDFSPDVFPPE